MNFDIYIKHYAPVKLKKIQTPVTSVYYEK